MNRIKLADRELPTYTKGEEIFNMVSHIVRWSTWNCDNSTLCCDCKCSS